MINLLNQNLKKLAKLITYFLIKNEEQIMINLVMQPLKEEVEEEVFQISIFRVPFQIYLVQIFLMTFLTDLEEQEVEDEEDLQILEEQI